MDAAAALLACAGVAYWDTVPRRQQAATYVATLGASSYAFWSNMGGCIVARHPLRMGLHACLGLSPLAVWSNKYLQP